MRTHTKKFIAFICLTICLSACGETQKPEIPDQTISIRQAQLLQQEFVSTRAGIINDSLKITDTRDFWFSLETMEEYIAYVKREGTSKGYENMGIRIFFAAYPKNIKDERADPGFSTVVLVPTVGEPTKANGFFPMAPIQKTAKGVNALNYGHGGHPPKKVE